MVVGTAGSGKTTMAAALAARLGLPHIELDSLHWGPNWTPAPREEFRARVEAAAASDSWVIDGNYGSVRDLLWPRAETVVWLDYPLATILFRLTRRTARRVFLREQLWSGNRERFHDQFIPKESLFVWAVTTHTRRRRQFEELMAQQPYGPLPVIRLRSPRAARRWLSGIPVSSSRRRS